MAAPDNQDRHRAGPATYFIIGVVLLFLMAFLWSADRSFRFIFAGLSAFFLFKAFHLRAPATGGPTSRFFEDFQNDMRTIFRPVKKPAGNYYGSPEQRRKKPEVIMVASLFIFFVFFTIIVAVVFVDGPAENSNFDEAEMFRMSGEYDSAIWKYREALRADPENVSANLGIGNAFLAQTKYDSALKYFNRSYSADPANYEAAYGMAQVEYYQNKYKASLVNVRRTLELNAGHVEAMELAGHNYYSQEHYDSALVWYEAAYALGEHNSVMCHIMGYIYQSRGENERAIALYKEAINYDSTNVEIYGRLDELLRGSEQELYRQLASRYSNTGEPTN
jgi:Tfp pilus assembly protein PilF